MRARYHRERDALTSVGFQELCFYSEALGTFSAVLYLPVLFLMLFKREVLGVRGRLEVVASYMLMWHRDPHTIALPLGLGVKLYTGFTDGTLLISANFPSCLQPSVDSIVKHFSRLTLDEVWNLHQQRVREMEGHGRQTMRSLEFDRYVEMSLQEESGSVCAPPCKAAKP